MVGWGLIDVYSSFSLRSGDAEFVQLCSLQVPHAAEQSSPYFLHEHLWETQSDLQLHLTIFNKDAWAAGRSVLTSKSLQSTSFQPQSCGGSAAPLHCCT